jgi:hypothetical protein
MNFMIINFILGVVNIFIAGMNCSMIFTRKVDGVKIDYKDYLATILPVTVGFYLLVSVIGQASTNS